MNLLKLLMGSLALASSAAEANIEVKGNKRTQTFYVKRIVEECLERQETRRWDLADLRQCVMNSRLFSDVKISQVGQITEVDVEEKWTLIPIPAVQTGSGKSTRVGAYVLETNFLGMGMTLAAGGTKSTAGHSYSGFLADPSIFFTNFHYNVTIHRQQEEVFHTERDKERDVFKELVDTYSFGLGYKWYPWSFTPVVVRQNRSYDTAEDYWSSPDAVTSARVGFTLNYDRRNYKLYFSEGIGFKLHMIQDVARSGDEKKASSVDAQVSWQKAVIGDHALQLSLSGGSLSGGGRGDAIRLGGARGVRGIESKTTWAERYCTAAIDYQIPLKTFPSGALTMAPFTDRGRIFHRNGQLDYVDFYTVGGGIYFFLKNIALPGLGFEMGYNDQYQKEFFAFSAGIAM